MASTEHDSLIVEAGLSDVVEQKVANTLLIYKGLDLVVQRSPQRVYFLDQFSGAYINGAYYCGRVPPR